MKNEDKWIQDIRNRMEDYSEPLPAGMWEQLESELDTPKVIPMWRKWQAAAAAVLVLAVSSLTLWFWSSPEADKLSKESRIAQQQIEEAVQPVVTPVEPVSEPDAGQLAQLLLARCVDVDEQMVFRVVQRRHLVFLQQQRRLLHQLGIAAILDVGIPQQHTGPACKNAQSQSGQHRQGRGVLSTVCHSSHPDPFFFLKMAGKRVCTIAIKRIFC